MALVFMSYTHTDRELADKIQNILERRGHHVWRDDTEFKVGAQIPEGVATGIALCDYFLLVITQNALQSTWMRNELNLYAMNPEHWSRILPLKCDNTLPKDFSPILASHKWADISENLDSGISKVLETLGEPSEVSSQKLGDLGRMRFAVDLAIRAGNVAMRFYNSSLGQNEALDDRKNMATRADRAAQNEVVTRIKSHETFQYDELIAEEKPYNNESAILENGYTWVVDPLDGTANFDRKIPFFCTAIGVLLNGNPYIGAVFNPVENEVYYAMDGVPTEVWNVSRGEITTVRTDPLRRSLKKSLIGTHISSRIDIAKKLLKNDLLLEVSDEVANLRAFGSGQLALAYVATGRLQGFFQIDTYLWDQVAGVVLVNNAGGCCYDLKSQNTWSYKTKNILASANEEIQNRFAEFWNNRGNNP